MTLLPLLLCCHTLISDDQPNPSLIQKGDRIVLLGSTFLEREQSYGHWETMLHRHAAGKEIIVRNLAWSGDTVWGEARAGFKDVNHGFAQLKKQVQSVKPTVIVIGYGTNESFAGKAGVPRFVAGLNRLLDALASTKARVILLSPMRQEHLGSPLPDPTKQNENLLLYTNAIRDVAKKREAKFVDLFRGMIPEFRYSNPPLTSNGVHLTESGYRTTTPILRSKLEARKPSGINVQAKNNSTRFTAKTDVLPGPEGQTMRIRGLSEGNHDLLFDGKVIHTATAKEWDKGVIITKGPDVKQAEQLRQAVIDKNRLYFHRWRPQNVTYLFGFRKHEQGQNAKEIAQFDPLIAKLDAKVQRLSVPMDHQYEIRRVGERGQ